ncbi:MAG: TonB-dependent receptor [Deltaproteobacteria bacterium]|nr:MAG: TonB-dependent receptor [Deltaproteobacteria bacterium]
MPLPPFTSNPMRRKRPAGREGLAEGTPPPAPSGVIQTMGRARSVRGSPLRRWGLLLPLLLLPCFPQRALHATPAASSHADRSSSPPTADPPPPKEEAHDEDTVVVTGETIVIRAESITESDPSAFTTVIEVVDEKERFTEIPRLLGREAGVAVRSRGGVGQTTILSIRGASPEQVVVLLDGEPINTTQEGRFDPSTLPTTGIERIEIIRGGSGTRYGSGAIGGVVNIVTRKAEGMDLTGAATLGSFGTFQASASLAGGNDTIRGRVSATHLQSAGDFPFETATYVAPDGRVLTPPQEMRRLDNDVRQENLRLWGEWRREDFGTLSTRHDLFWTERGQPGPETANDPTDPPTARQWIVRWLPRLSWRAPAGGWRFSLAGQLRGEAFTDPSPPLGDPDYTEGISVTSRNREGSLRGEWRETFTTLGTHAPRLGLTLRYARLDVTEEGIPRRHERRSFHLAAEDAWFLPGNRISLHPAGSLEAITRFGMNPAITFGVVGHPFDALSLEARGGNAYRVPTFDELYFPDEGYVVGNPDLRPERAWFVEGGGRFAWNWIRLEGALFHREIAESIVFLPISAFTFRPENTGPADLDGVEGTITLSLPPLSLASSYTWLRAIGQETGEQLPGRARHTFHATLALENRVGRIFGEVEGSGAVPLSATGTITLSRHVAFDAGATLELTELLSLRGPDVSLTLEGRNLGNASLRDLRDAPLPGRSFFLTLVISL